ncbi:MAG: hypothetical protein FWH36_05965 [Lentimicrobiaceae bacterium]|nr:hypothetical protein [Lentimicrobiaceae bacterium]
MSDRIQVYAPMGSIFENGLHGLSRQGEFMNNFLLTNFSKPLGIVRYLCNFTHTHIHTHTHTHTHTQL